MNEELVVRGLDVFLSTYLYKVTKRCEVSMNIQGIDIDL